MGINKVPSNSLEIGDMRSRANFFSNTPMANSSGGLVDNYTSFYQCRGRLLAMGSSRNVEQGDLVGNNKFEFVCRFSTELQAGLDEKTIINIDGDDYQVNTIELVKQIKRWYKFVVNLKV